MVRYLISPSLLDSFAFYKNSDPDRSLEGYNEFLRVLSRERSEPNEAMQRGIDFEYLVEKTCNWENIDWASLLAQKSEKLKSLDIEGANISKARSFVDKNKKLINCIEEVGSIVSGGIWQYPVKKEITINNIDFLLYGRTDVIKEDRIYDIKRVSKYKIGKYQKSLQYAIYLYCSNFKNFSYLICDGNSVYKEDYTDYNCKDYIISAISDFIDCISGDEIASKTFYSNWVARSK